MFSFSFLYMTFFFPKRQSLKFLERAQAQICIFITFFHVFFFFLKFLFYLLLFFKFMFIIFYFHYLFTFFLISAQIH